MRKKKGREIRKVLFFTQRSATPAFFSPSGVYDWVGGSIPVSAEARAKARQVRDNKASVKRVEKAITKLTRRDDMLALACRLQGQEFTECSNYKGEEQLLHFVFKASTYDATA